MKTNDNDMTNDNAPGDAADKRRVERRKGWVITPDGMIITPDGMILKPDNTIVTPGGTIIKNDGTVVTPGGTITAKDGVTAPQAPHDEAAATAGDGKGAAANKQTE